LQDCGLAAIRFSHNLHSADFLQHSAHTQPEQPVIIYENYSNHVCPPELPSQENPP
jgi:hypothetical protein